MVVENRSNYWREKVTAFYGMEGSGLDWRGASRVISSLEIFFEKSSGKERRFGGCE